MSTSENPVKKHIRHMLLNAPGFSFHSKCLPKNKKLLAFVSASGKTIAHELDYVTQYLWVPTEFVTPEVEDVRHTNYPAAALWAVNGEDGTTHYGRHSGLRKYPELAEANLTKFVIETTDDADKVLRLYTQNGELRP